MSLRPQRLRIAADGCNCRTMVGRKYSEILGDLRQDFLGIIRLLVTSGGLR